MSTTATRTTDEQRLLLRVEQTGRGHPGRGQLATCQPVAHTLARIEPDQRSEE